MGSLLYAIAMIFIIIWAIGFFAYSAGAFIHALLVVAIILILVRVILIITNAVQDIKQH